MARFQERLLTVAEACYRFIGGERQVSNFSLASPIQPVHDYSRQSELGARGRGAMGYLRVGQTLTNATAGATTIFASLDPYTAFDPPIFDFDARRHRLWMMDLYASVDTTDANNWSSAASGIAYDPSGTNRVRALRHWNEDLPGLTSAGQRPCVLQEAQAFPEGLPVYFPPGTLWVSNCISTNDCVGRVHATFWAGPIGTSPPGMS